MPFGPAVTPTPQAEDGFARAARQRAAAPVVSLGNAAEGLAPIRPIRNVAQGFLNKAGQYLDVPLAYEEALLHDVMTPGTGGSILDWATPQEQASSHIAQTTADLRRGGPAAVQEYDVYGNRGSLERVVSDPGTSRAAKVTAHYFLTHPWAAGLVTFGSEFANPSNLLGGAVGNIGGRVGRIGELAQNLDEAQALSPWIPGNRFAGLRVAGRERGVAPETMEAWGRRTVAAQAHADREAYDTAKGIFNGLSRDERLEVVHRMQGNVTHNFGKARNATIDERANDLRRTMWNATRDQLQAGVIDPQRIYGREQLFPGVFTGLSDTDANAVAQLARGEHLDLPEDSPLHERASLLRGMLGGEEPPPGALSYFPMRGAYGIPSRDEEYLEYINANRAGGGVGIRKGTAGLNAPRRQFPTLLESQQQAKLPIREDWDPAETLERFLSQRNRNVRLEDAMGELTDLGMTKPQEARTPGDRWASTIDVNALRMFGSSHLRGQAVPEQVANFVKEMTHAGATEPEALAFAHATTGLGKLLQLAYPAYHSVQNLMRQGVIFNPIVHGFWNLMFQYLGAGGDIREVPGILNFLGKIPENPEAEAAGVFHALGAPRTIGGKSAVSVMTKPWNELGFWQKASRAGAEEWQFNQHVVFDVMERRYASALFKTFRRRGMSADAAGNAVRRALGDYANVRNIGTDAALRQAFFFYPWLKTILPFWIKNGVTRPQTWNAPLAGIQTHNELAGDPNARSETENPFAVYTGNTNGQPDYWDMPLPQRILEPLGETVAGSVSGNAKERAKGFRSLILNRLNPIVGAGASTLGQVGSTEQQATGPFGYAPLGAKLLAGVQGLMDYIPAPLRGAAQMEQVLTGKIPLSQAWPQILGDVLGGFGYTGQGPQQAAAARYTANAYYRYIDAALRAGNKQQAWAYYQRMQQALNPPQRQSPALTAPSTLP